MSFIRPVVNAAVPNQFIADFSTNQVPVGDPWVISVPGVSFGGQGNNPFINSGVWRANAASAGNDDSVSFLKTSIGVGPNQTVTITISVTGSFGVTEVEGHLRTSWDPNNIFSYEFDIINSLNSVNLVRWDGGPAAGGGGSATQIGSGTLFSAVADGDIFVCKVDVSNNFSCMQNGHVIFSGINDATYTTGSCGLGGDVGSGNTNNIGVKGFRVNW